MRYSPCSSVCATNVRPESMLVAVIVTSGRTAAVSSLTTPEMAPFDWAFTTDAEATMTISSAWARHRDPRRRRSIYFRLLTGQEIYIAKLWLTYKIWISAADSVHTLALRLN